MNENNYAIRLREAEENLRKAKESGDESLIELYGKAGKALTDEICNFAGISIQDFNNACTLENELSDEIRQSFAKSIAAAGTVGWDEYVDGGFQFVRLLNTVYLTMHRFNETVGVKFFRGLPVIHAGNHAEALEDVLTALRGLTDAAKQKGAEVRANPVGAALDQITGLHGQYKGSMSPTLVAQYEVHGKSLARGISVFGLMGTITDNADMMETVNKLTVTLVERDKEAAEFNALYVGNREGGIFKPVELETLQNMAETAKEQAEAYRAETA